MSIFYGVTFSILIFGVYALIIAIISYVPGIIYEYKQVTKISNFNYSGLNKFQIVCLYIAPILCPALPILCYSAMIKPLYINIILVLLKDKLILITTSTNPKITFDYEFSGLEVFDLKSVPLSVQKKFFNYKLRFQMNNIDYNIQLIEKYRLIDIPGAEALSQIQQRVSCVN
jgi:hypothetical protein